MLYRTAEQLDVPSIFHVKIRCCFQKILCTFHYRECTHISAMRLLYTLIPVKTKTLTRDQILKYQMPKSFLRDVAVCFQRRQVITRCATVLLDQPMKTVFD